LINVSQELGSYADRLRKIHRCRFACWVGPRFIAVIVSIDEQKPKAAAAPERQYIAEQDAAVASKNDRKLPCINGSADGIGEIPCVCRNRSRVHYAGFRIWDGIVRRRYDA